MTNFVTLNKFTWTHFFQLCVFGLFYKKRLTIFSSHEQIMSIQLIVKNQPIFSTIHIWSFRYGPKTSYWHGKVLMDKKFEGHEICEWNEIHKNLTCSIFFNIIFMSHNILIIPDFNNRSIHFQKVNMFLLKLSSKVHILKASFRI
jgi:hypothetical protein